jgi:uncharacterized protein with GYD domain
MAKYLVKVSYNPDNIKDLLTDGAPDCRKTVEELIAPMGGKLESFYYTFGGYGVFCVSDIRDDITGAALKLEIEKSGVVTCLTAVLIYPEDIDKMKSKSAHYPVPAR